MADINLENRSLTDLAAFALGVGDSALQEQAEELRTLVDENVAQEFSPPLESWNPKGFRYKNGMANADQIIAFNIKKAWIEMYGTSIESWPENLRNSLATIEVGIGLTSFGNNLTAAFQNLRLYEETVPAFEAGVAVVRAQYVAQDFSPATSIGRSEDLRYTLQFSLIPDSSARAGLSFVSSPFALFAPIWVSGITGRAVTSLTANAGRVLALADEAIYGAAALFGLLGESTAFVASSDVVAQFIGQNDGPINRATTNSFIEETFASALFFGMLKVLGSGTNVLASLLPRTATGMTLAKLTGHAGSITALASTEWLQEKMGQNVAEGFSPPSEAWNAKAFRYTDERTFYAKLWRAAFLHATLQTTSAIIRPDGRLNISPEIVQAAREFQEALEAALQQRVAATNGNVNLPVNALFAAKKGRSGEITGHERVRPLASKAGKLIYVTPTGLKINHETKRYGQLLNSRLRTLRYNASGRTAKPEDADALKAFLKVKEAGSYRDLLVFFIAFDHGDRQSAENFKGFEDWPAKMLIETATEEFERMFPDAPELPTRQGIWTEFVEIYKALRSGNMRADQFVDELQNFALALRNEITISNRAVHFGPVSITQEELFSIFLESVRYRHEVKSKIRPTHKKALKDWLGEMNANKNAAEWLVRTDVPEDAKQKVCMINLLDPFNILEPEKEPGGSIIFRLFATGEIVKKPVAEQVRIIDDLYKRYVEVRLDPAKTGDVAAGLPSSHSDWKTVRMADMFDSDAPPSPNRSYTLFKRFAVVAEKVTRAIKNIYQTVETTPRALSRLNEDMGFLASFILNGTAQEQIRGMVLDILYHYNTKEPMVAERLRNAVEKFSKDPTQLRLEIYNIYREYFPFAADLFAMLAKEAAAKESPEAVAEGIWRRFELGQGEFPNGRIILQHIPAVLKAKLKTAMTKAFIAVQFDKDTYLPWIKMLEKLNGTPANWTWLESPGDIVETLQDLTYPLGLRTDVARPDVELKTLGFKPGGTSWQRFKALTSFLTPSEWNTLMETLEEAASNIHEAARAFESRFADKPLPAPMAAKKQLLRSKTFAETVTALSSIFEKSLGEANARLCRRLLRAILTDPDAIASLLEFSHKLHLIQSAGKFSPSQANETMTTVRDILDTGLITGDIVGLAMRCAFYKTQGVQAELAQVKDLVASGFKVKLIPPEAALFQKSPDIEAQVADSPNARPILIEVKSREWLKDFTKFGTLKAAIEEGGAQIDDRMKREFANHGFIALYLVGNTTSSDAQVLEQLDSLIRLDDLGGVKGLFVYFVDKSGREWKISERHEILAPKFRTISPSKPPAPETPPGPEQAPPPAPAEQVEARFSDAAVEANVVDYLNVNFGSPEFAAEWDKIFIGSSNNEFHARTAEALDPAFPRVMDLGTGTGKALLPIATRTRSGLFIGVDLATEMLDFARAKFARLFPRLTRRFFKANAEKMRDELPSEMKDLDVITARFLFNFVDLNKTLPQVLERLRDGGRLVFNVFAGFFWGYTGEFRRLNPFEEARIQVAKKVLEERVLPILTDAQRDQLVKDGQIKARGDGSWEITADPVTQKEGLDASSLEKALRSAGFEDIKIEPVEEEYPAEEKQKSFLLTKSIPYFWLITNLIRDNISLRIELVREIWDRMPPEFRTGAHKFVDVFVSARKPGHPREGNVIPARTVIPAGVSGDLVNTIESQGSPITTSGMTRYRGNDKAGGDDRKPRPPEQRFILRTAKKLLGNPSSVPEEKARLFFELTTANPDTFMDFFKRGLLTFKMTPDDEVYRDYGQEVNMQLNRNNLYAFLEPILKGILRERPDEILLIDNGARPFEGAIRLFLKEFGLDIPVKFLYASAQTGGHDLFDIYNSLKPREDEINGRHIFVVDDNVVRLKTGPSIANALQALGAKKVSYAAACTFNNRAREFADIATVTLQGDSMWIDPTRGFLSWTEWEENPSLIKDPAYLQELTENFERELARVIPERAVIPAGLGGDLTNTIESPGSPITTSGMTRYRGNDNVRSDTSAILEFLTTPEMTEKEFLGRELKDKGLKNVLRDYQDGRLASHKEFPDGSVTISGKPFTMTSRPDLRFVLRQFITGGIGAIEITKNQDAVTARLVSDGRDVALFRLARVLNGSGHPYLLLDRIDILSETEVPATEIVNFIVDLAVRHAENNFSSGVLISGADFLFSKNGPLRDLYNERFKPLPIFEEPLRMLYTEGIDILVGITAHIKGQKKVKIVQ